MITSYDKMAAEEQAKGHANLLLRQLRKRFGEVPDEITTRVRTASLPDLERWGDRILDARSLAEVFE